MTSYQPIYTDNTISMTNQATILKSFFNDMSIFKKDYDINNPSTHYTAIQILQNNIHKGLLTIDPDSIQITNGKTSKWIDSIQEKIQINPKGFMNEFCQKFKQPKVQIEETPVDNGFTVSIKFKDSPVCIGTAAMKRLAERIAYEKLTLYLYNNKIINKIIEEFENSKN